MADPPQHVGPVSPSELRHLLERVFIASGADESDASVVADVITDAELRDIRSQGLIRVPAYVKSAREGKIKSPTRVEVVRDRPGSLALDAGYGWPHVSVRQAFDMCVVRARESGSCWAVVKHTGHIGRLGYFVERVANEGMIAFLMAGGSKGSGWVAPWGGVDPLWGTNPLAVGFPRPDGPPVVIDISTTQTSRGNVLIAQRAGEELQPGLAFDKSGQPTTDPNRALPPEGTLAPLGGDVAGHKGYGLALMVHILCGVLGGPYPLPGGGNLVGVLDVEAFTERGDYEGGLLRLIDDIKAVPTKEGVEEILIPGERSARVAENNGAKGLYFPQSQWAELVGLARELNVQHDLLADN